MRISVQLQLAVAQCWFVSHITCTTIFDRISNNKAGNQGNSDLTRFERSLKSSYFAPGFGKRQSPLMQNELPLSTYTNTGNYLTGDESPYYYENDDADDDFVLNKSTLKALVKAYFSSQGNEVNGGTNIKDVDGPWLENGDRERTPDLRKRSRLLHQSMRNRRGWNSLDTDTLKK